MKKVIFLFSLLLSGCYLANGSPGEMNFWVKDGKKISFEKYNVCAKKVFPSLGDRYIYLYKKKEQLGWIEFYKNKREAEEYDSYLSIAFKFVDKCLYDSGYRFRPPLIWCLAQDGNNTKICIENMKYRN